MIQPRVIFLCGAFSILHSINAQEIIYPDTNKPLDTARIFGYGVLSDGLSNRDFTISPSGDEIFFTLQHPKFATSTILYMHKENGKWSSPEVASFSGTSRDIEATFSPDGQSVYFSSDRPVNTEDTIVDFDIWKVVKRNSQWGEPQHLGFTVNTSNNEFYPSVTLSGNLYFTVEAEYGKGKEDIVMCSYSNGNYDAPVSLSSAVNSEGYEFNAFVDPNERYILFTGYGREDDEGKGDLYISVKDSTGEWLAAKHLPGAINSTALDYCPFVSPDGKYLFFTSNRMNSKLSTTIRKNYNELKTLLNDAGNGLDDIYWIRFDESWLN